MPKVKLSRKERTEQLVAALKGKAETFQESDEAFLRFVRMSAKFHKYSPNNQWLIMWQRPDASAVNSYNRWLELGRQVSKGESAIWIQAPMTKKNALTGDTEVFGFVPVPVFAYEQTEPAEGATEVWEPYRFPTLTADTGQEYIDAIEQKLVGDGHTLKRYPGQMPYRGCFIPPRGEETTYTIELDSTQPTLQQLNTLVHEWAHALNWEMDRDVMGMERGRVAEFVAEASSYVVLHELGFDASPKSVSYIAMQHIAEEDEQRERVVLKLITDIVAVIIDRLALAPVEVVP